MYELFILVAGVVGIALAIFFLAPNTRNRGVRETSRLQRTAEAAERQMDHERRRIAERERRLRPNRRRF
ncbi:MAG: hypothetical protein ACW99V_06900 [Candidatus Thorarchaeota archaeon]|jgi:hypothetical protein